MQQDWWKSVTAYQIYPRSFCDSNGDGIGDLPGILSRLDHLADLGVGLIWLSPVYRSPMRDNGYDIADYRDIAPEFGTLEDMDRLIAAARDRGMRIVMDLVVNHTSDRHDWFLAARSDKDAPTRDFYVWRDPAPDGGPPSGLQSIFGGPAWTLTPETGQYYLHLFSREQPDLNWTNPALRDEIHAMMRWWLDRGIGGFRMDVIDLIGKDIDRNLIGEGPHLWDYLAEMEAQVLRGTDAVTIGESWAASLTSAPNYVKPGGPLSMIFQFDHVMAFWKDRTDKWQGRLPDVPTLRRSLFDWQRLFRTTGWNAIFMGNHDLPRAVSHYGDGSAASAKALATLMLTLRGTPFIYQGDELGTPNAGFGRADEYRDVETLNMLAAAPDPKAGLAGALLNGRDNGRTPMRWTNAPGAGFTDAQPWIGFGAPVASATEQAGDPASVLSHYRQLIALRNDLVVLQTGTFDALEEEHPRIVAFSRGTDGQRVDIWINLSSQEADLPHDIGRGAMVLMDTHAGQSLSRRLAPWRAVILDRAS